jgi:hypothetical protein
MPDDTKHNSFLDRYIALRTLRDNVFYQKPLTYNSLDFVDDIPGPARGASLWFSDLLPALGTFSRNPEKRQEQINQALEKAKASKSSGGVSAVREALRNAAVLGVTGIPASAATSSIFRLLGARGFVAGGKLRSPFTLGQNLTKFKTDRAFRKNLLTDVLKDSAAGGIFSASAGAASPLIAATAKPSDSSLDAAAKFLQESPVLGALPPGDLVHALSNSETSRGKNIALGAGLGGLLGAAGSFVPAALNIPGHLASAALLRKSPLGPIAKDFLNTGLRQIPLNTAILAGSGALAGAAIPPRQKNG